LIGGKIPLFRQVTNLSRNPLKWQWILFGGRSDSAAKA
jgi:hypothetical protein